MLMSFFLPCHHGDSVEEKLFNEACRKGGFATIRERMADYKDKGQRNRHEIPGGCFSAAATYNRPGVLLYLCDQCPPYLSSDAALSSKSTAIFQTFLERDWDINHVFHRLIPPPLGLVLSGLHPWKRLLTLISSIIENEQLVTWFVNNGANPNARCDWDITPMSAAVRLAPLPAIRLLFEHGRDISKGQLLHFAVERQLPDQLAVVDWLVRLGAPISDRLFEDDPASWVENKNFGMGTPLHRAAELGNADVAVHLIQHGAHTSIRDTLGRNAAELAESQGFNTVVHMMRCYRKKSSI